MLQPNDIYYAARKLLPYLSANLQTDLSNLLIRAEGGEKVYVQLIDFLAEHDENARNWLRSAIYGFDEKITRAERFAPLAGTIGSVEAHTTWVCPKENGHFTWYVREAGMPVPPCPKHKIKLIISTTKKDYPNAR